MRNETFWFYCGKKAKGIIYHKQKGVHRTTFKVCDARCRKFKNTMNCEAYADALDEHTTPIPA